MRNSVRSETARAGSRQVQPRRGTHAKGNVLVPLEAIADRLQGSVSGSGGAREAKRPQPQGKQEQKCDSNGDRGADAAQAG